MAGSSGRRRGRRLLLMGIAVLAAGGVGIEAFGPETWRQVLHRTWLATLSPRQPVSDGGGEPPRDTEPRPSKSIPDAEEPELPQQIELTGLSEEPEEPPEPRRLPASLPQPEPLVADDLPADESEPPLEFVQAKDDGQVPIVDKPPRKLPATAAEKIPAADEKPSPQAEKPAVSQRPGLHQPLAAIEGIEDKVSRSRPLVERANIEKALELGDLPTALREFSRWYWRHPDLREALHPRLVELSNQVYFSPRPHFHEPYVIQPGDRLQTIARKFHVPWEYLCRANHVNAKKIRAGQKLKVVDGPFAAYISLSNYELIVHHQGAFVRWYPVGVGKAGSTPTGTFTVREKLVDPTYYGDDGLIKADDPKNPLGERWIDIGDSYGIHGTIDPSSIGRNESRGCVRLLNEDVEELYDLLSIGSEVTIQQ